MCLLDVCLFVCLFVCVFVDTKTSILSETGHFMSCTYCVRVRNLASHEQEHTTGSQEKQTFLASSIETITTTASVNNLGDRS